MLWNRSTKETDNYMTIVWQLLVWFSTAVSMLFLQAPKFFSPHPWRNTVFHSWSFLAAVFSSWSLLYFGKGYSQDATDKRNERIPADSSLTNCHECIQHTSGIFSQCQHPFLLQASVKSENCAAEGDKCINFLSVLLYYLWITWMAWSISIN